MEEKTEWLKSPVSERALRLQPRRELWLKPYQGKRRRVVMHRTEISIGSRASCDIHLDDPYVSPLHAEFRLEAGGGGYVVQDLSSRNGVFLNGVRVSSAPLPSSGNLRLGRSVFNWSNEQAEIEFAEDGWVIADPSMRELLISVQRIATSSMPVLLLGETGTGKDVIARMLHHWSSNPLGPYIPVNGALTGGALAESELFGHRKGAFTGADSSRLGALRSAHGGTLFLDEIADVPIVTQVKLLRSLESGEIKALGADHPERSSFRLITATSRNLDRKMREGLFRNDLYYRIAGFVIHVPPLRDRPKDIIAIATKLAMSHGFGLVAEAEALLLQYSWPGNVRELRSCIERGVVTAKVAGLQRILPMHLSGLGAHVAGARSEDSWAPRTLAEIEREFLSAALERHGWSRTLAAKELGIARSTIWQKMRRFGLGAPVTALPGSE